MILQIILCLSIVNLFVNFYLYSRIKKLIIEFKSASIVDADSQMSQIESDLNRRLRSLQTSQFSPKMGRSNIRLVRDHNGDK